MRRFLFSLPLALTLWLYWPILRLPNLYDTLLHIQIAHNLSWGQAWLPTAAFGYFRPLVFVPLVTVRMVWGGYPAAVLQTINLLQHTLNVGLVGWLVWRLWGNQRQSLTAALLFATFPFSYQALAIYGNNVHLTILNFMLLALYAALGYWQGGGGAGGQGSRGAGERRSGGAEENLPISHSPTLPFPRFWPILLAFGAALLTHESSVTFVPLAGLLFLAWRGRQTPAPSLALLWGDWRAWSLVGFTALYLVGYSFLPIGAGPQPGADGPAWGAKMLLFGQVLAYPITQWAHRLPHLSAVAMVGAGLLVVAGMAIWSAATPHHRWPLLLGLGWWLGVAVVMALPLPTYYVATSARLHYFGSAGLAIGWLWLLEAVWGRPWWRKAVWGAAVLLILLPSGWFVRHMLALYQQTSTPFAQLTTWAADWPPADGVVLVNWPQWAALPRNVFPTGADFAPVLGDHILPQAIVEGNLGRDRAPTTIMVEPALLTATAYPYGTYQLMAEPQISPLLATRQHIVITHYTAAGPVATHTGWLDYAPPAVPAPQATLGDYELLAATAENCAGVVHATLTLHPRTADISPTAVLFVQLLGADGRLLGQADGPPLGLPAARYQFSPALLLHDQRPIPLTAEGTPAHLLVGLYDYATGERQPALSATNTPLPDNGWRQEIRPCGAINNEQ